MKDTAYVFEIFLRMGRIFGFGTNTNNIMGDRGAFVEEFFTIFL